MHFRNMTETPLAENCRRRQVRIRMASSVSTWPTTIGSCPWSHDGQHQNLLSHPVRGRRVRPFVARPGSLNKTKCSRPEETFSRCCEGLLPIWEELHR